METDELDSHNLSYWPRLYATPKNTHLRDEPGRLLRHHVLQAVEHGFGRSRVLERVRLGRGGGPFGCGRFFQERAVDVVLGEVGSEGDERGRGEVRAVRAEELTAGDGASGSGQEVNTVWSFRVERASALFPDGERRLRFRRRVKVLCDDETGDAAQYDDEGEREEDLVPDVCAWYGMAELSDRWGRNQEEEEGN